MKWSIKHSRTIAEVICFLYAVLFTYAGSSKLLGLEDFKDQLAQTGTLAPFAGWIAWSVPLVEILLALLLLTKAFRLAALYGALGLMALFTTYIAWMLRFSDHIPCSCGGIIPSMGWKSHLVFNACWMALALISIVLMENNKKKTNLKNTVQ